jgi:NAD(P)-dependent dehydrogenase (short-subunit alcohol dehydrogenase family)
MSLLPSIARAEDPRIVCTTSSMHYYGTFNLSNANTTAEPRSYSHNKLYFQTWLTALQSRLSSATGLNHVTVNGVHPGFVNTGIWTPVQGGADAQPPTPLNRLLNKITSFFAIDPQQGSLAIVRAATAKECAVAKRGGGGGGRYFNRIWPSESMPQTTSPVCMQLIWEFVDRELSLKAKGLLHLLDDE